VVAALCAACDGSPDTSLSAVPATPVPPAAPAAPPALTRPTLITPADLVASLSFDEYRSTIEQLASFGDRRTGSDSYAAAERWVAEQLTAAGYVVEYHVFDTFSEGELRNTYVTKIGRSTPDEMLIVGAHLDGMGGGGGGDDDASGAALVLQAALSFAPPEISTGHSIRFIFFDSEETGLDGSRGYVRDRKGLQGVESPAGSGRYPEPRWIGMIQHDMLLYDHGLPPGPEQSAEADLDIEYRSFGRFSNEARALAQLWLEGNRNFSSDYPAEIGGDMDYTDSASFAASTAAISVRENRRVAEIGVGSNPHWHQPTDVYSSYSEADFRLGFNALQMTVGALAGFSGLP
jgi:hypothetical protein